MLSPGCFLWLNVNFKRPAQEKATLPCKLHHSPVSYINCPLVHRSKPCTTDHPITHSHIDSIIIILEPIHSPSPLYPKPNKNMSTPRVLAVAALVLCVLMSSPMGAYAGNFFRECDITWGGRRARILEGGQLLTLSLDRASGSGFQSKQEYLFGRIDMQLKLVAGNSAGTVTTYYVSISSYQVYSFNLMNNHW